MLTREMVSKLRLECLSIFTIKQAEKETQIVLICHTYFFRTPLPMPMPMQKQNIHTTFIQWC